MPTHLPDAGLQVLLHMCELLEVLLRLCLLLGLDDLGVLLDLLDEDLHCGQLGLGDLLVLVEHLPPDVVDVDLLVLKARHRPISHFDRCFFWTGNVNEIEGLFSHVAGKFVLDKRGHWGHRGEAIKGDKQDSRGESTRGEGTN